MKHFHCMSPLVVLIALVACSLGEKARQTTGWPAVQSIWPEIRQNIAAGFATALPTETTPVRDLAAMEAAIQQETHTAVRSVNWSALEPWAARGIDAGTESEGVKISFRERLHNFHVNVLQLQRTTP